MTQTLIDHARILIREEINKADRFVAASVIASEVHKAYPSVDFQTLINAVIEEAVAARGSVTWHKSEDENPEATSNRMIRYAVHR
jgi:hypothetical protein